MTYLVFHGAEQQAREVFTSFPDALACYRKHRAERPCGAAIFGENFDGSEDGSDGLTDEEREQVEATCDDCGNTGVMTLVGPGGGIASPCSRCAELG